MNVNNLIDFAESLLQSTENLFWLYVIISNSFQFPFQRVMSFTI